MKTVVIYFSKTGFTEKYAKWLAEDLRCDCVPFDHREQIDFSKYDAVVFGSSAHAGQLRESKWFQEKLPVLTGKKLALFSTGAAPADSAPVREYVEKFSGAEWGGAKAFYLWSGIDYEKMHGMDKMMILMFRKMLRGKKDATPDEQAMAQGIQSSFDEAKRDYLKPLEDYLRDNA